MHELIWKEVIEWHILIFQNFIKKQKTERTQALLDAGVINEQDRLFLSEKTLLPDQIADHMIENQLTQYALPLGVA